MDDVRKSSLSLNRYDVIRIHSTVDSSTYRQRQCLSVTRYVSTIVAISKGDDIPIEWPPAHVGIPGNEAADAAEAHQQISERSISFTASDAKRMLDKVRGDLRKRVWLNGAEFESISED